MELHTQKKSHKEKETEIKSSRQSPNGSKIAQLASNELKNNANCRVGGDQVVELKAASSVSSVNSNDNQSFVRENSQNMVASPSRISNATKLDKAIVAKMIDFVTRTETRIHNESQILKTLIGYLNAINYKVQLVPFGSSTYGYGGSSTNFNILANAGQNNNNNNNLSY